MHTPSPPPPRPARTRVGAIDGLRGVLLILMLNTHLPLSGRYHLLHPDTVSLLDAASGFVFMSGLVCGMVHISILRQRGFRAAAVKLWRRAGEVYLYLLGILLGLAVGSSLIPGAGAAWAEWIGPLHAADARVVASAALLLSGAEYADILQPYVVYLAVAPLALWLCARGRGDVVLAASVILWAATQFGITEPVTAALEGWLKSLRPDLALPRTFNLAAWQLLFFAGLVAGATRTGVPPMRPERPGLFWLAMVLLAGFAAFKIVLFEHGDPAFPAATFGGVLIALADKARAQPFYLANALICFYALGWLLAVGRSARQALVRTAARLLDRVLNLSFLRLLGRHSLHVYVWHVVLVYALKLAVERWGSPGEWVSDGLFLLAVALLAVPALWREAGLRARREGSVAVPVPASQPAEARAGSAP